jgi:hypothetical protein
MGLTVSTTKKYCDLDQGQYYASNLELLANYYSFQLPVRLSRKYIPKTSERHQRALFAHILERTIVGLQSGRLGIHVCDYHVADCVAIHSKISLNEMLEKLAKEIRLQGDMFKRAKFEVRQRQNVVLLKLY